MKQADEERPLLAWTAGSREEASLACLGTTCLILEGAIRTGLPPPSLLPGFQILNRYGLHTGMDLGGGKTGRPRYLNCFTTSTNLATSGSSYPFSPSLTCTRQPVLYQTTRTNSATKWPNAIFADRVPQLPQASDELRTRRGLCHYQPTLHILPKCVTVDTKRKDGGRDTPGVTLDIPHNIDLPQRQPPVYHQLTHTHQLNHASQKKE
ncbi:hypothetical protein GE09DRAFT_1108355 [Coniochaeta sp. 2T2.1]|nr:hypothetical protein GE09DRAFT_1108355 [Coniochaeta sp. 2T2.1]